MTERLPSPSPRTHESLDHTPDVDPALVREIDSIENNMNRPVSPTAEKLQAVTDRVRGFLERRAINKAHGAALEEDAQRTREAQDAAYDTYANNIAYTAEKERLIDPRSRLRKIGDSALRLQERIGKSAPTRLLARWGIIPPVGTRHKQRGFNFSAMVARQRVRAQTARKNREERISAGFLSAEDQARLDAMDETTPEKIAQDAAYGSYAENIEATAKRERQDAAKREAQEQAYDSYADNIDTTAKREAQDEAYATYVDNLATTTEREQAEKDAQREAFDSYAENIDATAKRELQEATYDTYTDNINATARREAQEQAYDSYADNIDATAKRESQEAAYESYEPNIEAAAERERREAHNRAAEATADRDERHERRPIREHATNLKERLGRLRGRIGSSAMKLLGRTKAGLKTVAGAFKRGR